MKPIIGLIGGIGAGKSAVAKLLQDSGAAVIDADKINHEQLKKQTIINTLVSWWGELILKADGSLDRSKIAQIVFNSKDDLIRLEKLTHPLILLERDRLFDQFQTNPDVWGIVWDAPVLIESGSHRGYSILFIDAKDEIRLQRVKGRGWTEEQWRARERNQTSLRAKMMMAHYIITNNGNMNDLAEEVHSFVTWMQSKSHKRGS